MRVRIERLRLVGTSREVEFHPGLNVIAGPIASGKTTALKLCRFLLGSTSWDFIREIKGASFGVAGSVLLGDQRFSIVRPLVSTADALVEIAGSDTTARLPAYRSTGDSPAYGDWLLEKLDLPRLRVPRAPTQPDSPSTPVTINDYLLYCDLAQNEIDDSVFGHRDTFKNIKRKYVFDILYGRFGIEMAQLYEELRDLDPKIRVLSEDRVALERVLSETPWENRAELERAYAEEQRELDDASESVVGVAEAAPTDTAQLRDKIRELDDGMESLTNELSQEITSRERLGTLLQQLHTQIARLTRSIVADELLLDFEFLKCPRCGAEVDESREEAEQCRLCLQRPEHTLTRDDLLSEQKRISAQIGETQELIRAHETRADELRERVRTGREERDSMVAELDFRRRSYLSDAGDALSRGSARRAAAQERKARLKDYLEFFERMDRAVLDARSLQQQKEDLEAQLEAQRQAPSRFSENVQELTDKFRSILESFSVPRFQDVEDLSRIDLRTYLPILYGRRFDELSSQGLMVLVNVAHAVAHQEMAMAHNVPLPNILFIDGLTSNIGHEDLDQERVDAIYEYLIALSDEAGDRLQIIVADHNVPKFATRFITLRLSEEDRFVPTKEG